MTRLQVQLFGPFEVSVDGKPASGFDSDKVRALLAYLVTEADQPHRREKLVGLLWPDFPERAARTSLRRALSNLRQVIGDRTADPPYLIITRQTIQFNTTSDAWVDVVRFAALNKGYNGQPPSVAQLVEASDIYRSRFLEGFSLPDSPPFEEWQRLTSESLQQQLLRTLNRLTDHYAGLGQHEQALRYARLAVEIDPYQEDTHRRLMQLLVGSGERAQALAQFEELRALLSLELGVEPDRETIELYTQIDSGAYKAGVKKLSLPSGTVTFLFSDIEGSTHLLQQLGPDRYGELLTTQRNILRSHFALHQGQEIDTQGDAFFVSFPRAKDAVEASAEIQQALSSYEWPESLGVKVRMGLHTGEPWLIEEGYVGMDVHRAARIAHVGHSGQVLLSETTTALVQDELPENVTLLDLGCHRLKDMRRPETIHQLVIEGLPSEFPVLSSLEVVAEPGRVAVEVNGHPPREVGRSPYRGLAAFQEEDAGFFFGRETFIQQLQEALGKGNLVAVVVGSSGSGKSSAVYAGLLPQLRSKRDWLTISMRPGTHPFHALSTALLPLLEPNVDGSDHLFASQKLADGLRAGEISLFHTINRVMENEGTISRLLLVLDQFEELYTLCPDADIRQAFTDELLAAVETGSVQRPNPVSILLTLRADFMGQALANRPFADAMQKGSLLLGPMNREELKVAVEKPAELQGAAFETGLVTRILDDVGDEPGNLPLLEFALTLLWDQMENGWMTHQVYDEIGRVEGALSRYAAEFFAGLNPVEQEQARQIFIQLVQPGQGTEDTRRVAKRKDLAGVDWGLVQHLADRRLVVTALDEAGDETVEVVHEALIRGWGQLREWMASDREFRNWQEGLRVALRGWENSGKDEGALLRGAPLVQAEEWLDQREDEISLQERGFIQTSIEHRQKRIAEQEKRRRFIIGGLLVGLVVAVLLSVFALGQRQSALDSAAEAQNVALIAASRAALANHDTDTALALAWQAVALHPDSALAQAQLSETAYAPGSVRILTGNEAIVNRVVVSPNGEIVVGVGTDGNVISWDLETGNVLWKEQAFTPEELVEAEDKIKVEGNHGVFSPDGQVFAASFDNRILFWRAADGQLIRQIESAALDQKITFSPNGDQFATIGKEEEGRLVFWDFASGRAVREFNRGSHIENFTYTADGSEILLASQTGELTLLDAQTGQVIYEVQTDLGTSAGPLFSVSISPDGTRVAANFSNLGVLVWDLETGDLLQDFRFQGGVDTVAFHPLDGTILTGGGGVLQTIDPQTGEVLRANTSQNSSIFHLAITPDGTRAVTTALDGTVRLWDLQDGQVVRRYPAPDATLFKVTLSPDARSVLVGSTDGSATIWDVETGEEIQRFVDNQPILSVAFSPDGRKALTGAGYRLAEKVESGHIILWDVETGEEIRRFEGQPYAVFGVDFSPDGQLAVSAGNGAMAILWDVETGEEIRRFEDYWEDYIYPDKSYWDVKFSPDGKQLFASHSSGAIIGWDVESGQKIRELVGHMIGGKITFSEDGQRLVSGSADSQVILWETQSGNIIRRISDHAGGVGEVRFSPDETLLLGGGEDGTSSLWRAETGEEIRRYGSGFVFSSKFSPDGRHAVVGYRDGRVELWRIDTTLDELLTWTQNNRYIPELTCEQRELYRVEPLCETEP